jgi:hypothetical protein
MSCGSSSRSTASAATAAVASAPGMTAERRRCAGQLSFWLPGLGQLYLRRWITGATLLAASWIASDRAWYGCSATWTVAALALWLVAVADARRT